MKFQLAFSRSSLVVARDLPATGFFHKSFQEFFLGYFLVFSVIDNGSDSYSVLTDVRHVNELSRVLKFVSGIVAQRSEEAAVSIIESIASIVNIMHLSMLSRWGGGGRAKAGDLT